MKAYTYIENGRFDDKTIFQFYSHSLAKSYDFAPKVGIHQYHTLAYLETVIGGLGLLYHY